MIFLKNVLNRMKKGELEGWEMKNINMIFKTAINLDEKYRLKKGFNGNGGI